MSEDDVRSAEGMARIFFIGCRSPAAPLCKQCQGPLSATPGFARGGGGLGTHQSLSFELAICGPLEFASDSKAQEETPERNCLSNLMRISYEGPMIFVLAFP